MTTVWRLNIKTDAIEGVNPRKFCIDKQILGVGWLVDCNDDIDWDTYSKLAASSYENQGGQGWKMAPKAIKIDMQLNDLCWTRDWNGLYYLGRITGEWKYCGDKAHRDADVVNVRDCIWKKVGLIDAVPGKVVNSFIPPRTVQRVLGESVLLYSQFLYNSLSGHRHYDLKPESPDLFTLISSEDCEDLVGLFLQEQGYRLIPSSCKSSTLAYEFVLVHSETGKKAVTQVKQGSVDLNIEEFSESGCEVYLFTSLGNYVGTSARNVHCIDPQELRKFANEKRNVMPDRIKYWFSILDEFGT